MDKKLPGLLVNSYGFASMTFTLMMSLALNYYSIFLTDVALIAAAHVGTIMLITHLVDAFSIPVSGSIIQRTQLRWGQFRSWLLFPPISTCIFFTLTFTNLPLSYNLKVVYLSLAYMIAHVSLNFAYNAHLGLISVLATSVKERLRLSTRNIQFGMASQIIFSLVVVKYMLYYFSEQSQTWGYFYTVGILAVVQVFGYWFLFYQSKNYDTYNPNKKLAPVFNLSFKEMITQVLGNKHLRLIMSGDIAVNLGIFSLSTLAPYYFKYVTGNEKFMVQYTLILGTGTFFSTLIAPMVVKKLGKKRTYMFAGAWGTIGYSVLRIFGASDPWVYAFIVFGSVLGAATSYPIRQAMYMDSAEYGFYKTGKDASAFIMAMFTLPTKISIALATTIAGYGLALIGYEANMEATPQFISKLMNLICFIPAGCGFTAFTVMSFYSLKDDKLAEIMEANAKTRAEAKA